MFKHLCLRLRENHNQHPDTEENETSDGETEEPQAQAKRPQNFEYVHCTILSCQ